MIELDGSFGEGGGSMIRLALALSMLTGEPFSMTSIRSGRQKPGLQPQHLSAVQAAETLCSAKISGCFIGSTNLTFKPGEMVPRLISIDIGTAGSITLLLQALILPCAFSGGKYRIKLTGGTDTMWSMPFDYFRKVYLDAIRDYANIDVEIVRRGYYPEGGGKAELNIFSRFSLPRVKNLSTVRAIAKGAAPELILDKLGNMVMIKGESHASSGLRNGQVAERQAAAARLILSENGFDSSSIKISAGYSDSGGLGSGITLWAEFDSGARIGADSLGDKAKPAEEVGKEAGQGLIAEVAKGAPVDSHLADQLIPIIGLFGGRMKVAEITPHCLANIYVFEKFYGKTFGIDTPNRIISA
jgi:RNA 3'-terminal phosphate cyclase (GTP)